MEKHQADEIIREYMKPLYWFALNKTDHPAGILFTFARGEPI
mgnify:FL=1